MNATRGLWAHDVLSGANRRGVFVSLALTVLLGCASLPTRAEPERDEALDGVLRLIGRFAAAHACPVSKDVALTSAHVADIRPFDDNVPLYPYRYSTISGQSGVLIGAEAERASDLAAMRPATGDFLRWYEIAKEAPKPGDRVRFLAYEFDNRARAYEPKVRVGKVLRVVSAHVVMDIGGPAGSSGSCVLNDAGQVVAINAWERSYSYGASAGVAVGVWGNWGPSLK